MNFKQQKQHQQRFYRNYAMNKIQVCMAIMPLVNGVFMAFIYFGITFQRTISYQNKLKLHAYRKCCCAEKIERDRVKKNEYRALCALVLCHERAYIDWKIGMNINKYRKPMLLMA